MWNQRMFSSISRWHIAASLFPQFHVTTAEAIASSSAWCIPTDKSPEFLCVSRHVPAYIRAETRWNALAVWANGCPLALQRLHVLEKSSQGGLEFTALLFLFHPRRAAAYRDSFYKTTLSWHLRPPHRRWSPEQKHFAAFSQSSKSCYWKWSFDVWGTEAIAPAHGRWKH